MKIRLWGGKDMIERLQAVLHERGVEARPYPVRGNPSERRLYVDVDDRRFERLLELLERQAGIGASVPATRDR